MSLLQRFFTYIWYRSSILGWLLWPLSLVFSLLASIRSTLHKKRSVNLPVPVVIVGNISVGGTGKTPVLIALAKALQEKGIVVGVVSRGYGSQAPYYPYLVGARDTAKIVGDEPSMIAIFADCPVVIGSDRVAAATYLLEKQPHIDIILSDDGLQHYKLGRSREIVVIDGVRGLGNHHSLPAGPLREPASRLGSVDWIIVNGGRQPLSADQSLPAGPSLTAEKADANTSNVCHIELKPTAWKHVLTQINHKLTPLPWGTVPWNNISQTDADVNDKSVENNTLITDAANTEVVNHNSAKNIIAMAGIGNPQRFFNTLESLNIYSQNKPLNDHYHFSSEDFSNNREDIVLMTEKDAVKCREFAHENCWSLLVDIELPEMLINDIATLVSPSTPTIPNPININH